MTLATAYSFLGLSPRATQAEARKAWRRLSKVHHPDVGGSQTAFVLLGAAYGLVARDLLSRGGWAGKLPPSVEEPDPASSEAPPGRPASSRSNRSPSPPDPPDGFGLGMRFDVLELELDGGEVPVASVRDARLIVDGESFVIQMALDPFWHGGTSRVRARLAWKGEAVTYVRPVHSTSRERDGGVSCLSFSPAVAPRTVPA